jgi:hypothetical protein
LSHNDLLLKSINESFEDNGKTNESFVIDLPSTEFDDVNEIDDEAEYDPNAEVFFEDNVHLLNDDQRAIFDTIKIKIDAGEGGMYNFDAPGGSGKTFLANVILAYAGKNDKLALASALSAIAATLLTLGTTFHRRFGVPIPTFSDSSSKIKLNTKEANVIRDAVVIMIDEVSMMNYKLLELLDRFLRALMGVDEYMGGKLIILMHDFCQILPVIPQGRRADIVAAAVINSDIWDQFTPLQPLAEHESPAYFEAKSNARESYQITAVL